MQNTNSHYKFSYYQSNCSKLSTNCTGRRTSAQSKQSNLSSSEAQRRFVLYSLVCRLKFSMYRTCWLQTKTHTSGRGRTYQCKPAALLNSQRIKFWSTQRRREQSELQNKLWEPPVCYTETRRRVVITATNQKTVCVIKRKLKFQLKGSHFNISLSKKLKHLSSCRINSADTLFPRGRSPTSSPELLDGLQWNANIHVLLMLNFSNFGELSTRVILS